MKFGAKLLGLWISISLFFAWKRGLWANVDPDLGGDPKNKWNTPYYCCVYWKSKACYKELQRDSPKECSSPQTLELVSCYPPEPTFELYDCDIKFKGPEHAESCQLGDEWPACILRELRVNPMHKLSIVMHLLALGLFAQKMRFWPFVIITALTLI